MAGPSVEFTEEGRVKLAKFLGFGHWVCILPSFICLILALVVQVTIEDKIAFIENYNGAVLPGLLVFTGLFGLIAHILSGKAFYTNRLLDEREKWTPFLIPAISVTAIIFLFEFISGIMCFVHISDLEESFNDGIRKAMAAYKNDATAKEQVDVLQMAYSCCGSRSYRDWFSTSWIHPDYMNAKKRGTTSDDVPFSCCSTSVLRPCIHYDVHENARHYKYDYRTGTTLNSLGCTDRLMAFFEGSVLTTAGAIVLSLSFIQVGYAFWG
ncbi:PRPH2-like protein [Mya arenaria]|uniref:PRPH2-like protein n=1 Tax=Mya arenaria TaxID=6604 RepID=A0ABY7GCV9_MYAAR|nr:PRPH2-like protein [Mya arenaria]